MDQALAIIVDFSQAIEYVVVFLLGVASAAWLLWTRRQRVKFALMAGGLLILLVAGSAAVEAIRDWKQGRGPTALTVRLQVRSPGERLWAPETYARPGDTVEYLLTIRNLGPGRADDVVARVNASADQQFVCSSMELRNGSNLNGVRLFSTSRREQCPGRTLFQGNY